MAGLDPSLPLLRTWALNSLTAPSYPHQGSADPLLMSQAWTCLQAGVLGVGGLRLCPIPWDIHYSRFERPGSSSSASVSLPPPPASLREEEQEGRLTECQGWRRDRYDF